MEGLSHITSASPVENFLPLARPQKRKAGFTKASIASAASLAALAMFGPKVADANQVTITVQGTFSTLSQSTTVPHSTQGVFGPTGTTTNTPFNIVYTFDDTKGTSTPSTGAPTEITGSGASAPGTVAVTVEGVTVSIGPSSTTNATAERGVGATQSSITADVSSGALDDYADIVVQNASGNPIVTKSPDWRSPVTFAPQPTDTVSGTIQFYQSVTGGTEAAKGYVGTITQITVSSSIAPGVEAGKDQGTQQALCDCDGNKPVNPSAGDPITIASGNMVLPVTDYQSGGTNQLAFTRTYNSMGSGYATFATSLGTGWRSNYDRYLNTSAVGNSPGVVTAERADGQMFTFTNSGGGWVSDADTDVTLSLSGSGSTWTLKDHNDVTETYNDPGTGEAQLTTITQRNGYSQSLTYTSGQLTTVTDSYSRSLSLTYSGGFLSTVTTPNGLMMTYGYGASGLKGATNDLLTSVAYNTTPTATSQTYKYELTTTQPLLLTGIVDENGNRAATWAYDSMGRATSSERFKDAAATMPVDVMSVSYNNTTGQRTVTNPLGLQDTYTYVVDHGLPKVSEIDRAMNGPVAAASRTFHYDTNGFQDCSTQWMNAATACTSVTTGDATHVTNNIHGQPTSITEAYGSGIARTTGLTYDLTFIHQPATITEPTRTTTNAYDGSGASCSTTGTTGNLCSSTVADTLTSTPSRTYGFAWNGTGELTQATDPRGNATNLAYATCGAVSVGAGNLACITDALSHVTTFTSYDLDGRLKSTTDPNGLITNLAYDTRGLLVTRAEGSGTTFETTTLTRDATETLTGVTNPDGSTLTLGRDSANRLTSITNILGEQIKYTLDAADNRTAINVYNGTALGNTLNRSHTYTYDVLNRMATDVGATNPSSQVTTYSYDINSNLTGVSDPVFDFTSYGYDILNRTNKITDPEGQPTLISYSADTRNLVATVTSPRGLGTSYSYDGFGDTTQTVSPDSGTTNRTFDLAGNLGSLTDAKSNTTTYAYDALNRVKDVTYADSTVTHHFYDSATNAIGRLKQVAEGSGSNYTSFTYDIHGRVAQKHTNLTTQDYFATYSPTTGQLTSETYPSGMVLGYKYDTAGQMKEIDLNGLAFLAHATHQPFGPAKEWDWVSNITHYARTYDADGRLSTLPLASDTRTVSYDFASRVSSLADTTAAITQGITYDLDSRIATYSFTGSGTPFGNGSISNIGYDNDGNRNTITYASTGIQNYTIDPSSNKITARGGTSYSYDADGNTTAEGAIGYTYDLRNRTSSTNSTTNYTYSGLDEIVSRVGTGGAERYAWSAASKSVTGHLLGIYNTSNATFDEVLYLDGNIPVGGAPTGGTGETRDTALRVFAGNQNEPRRATDNHANLYWMWDSDPFGIGTANQQPSGPSFAAFFNDMRFPGQIYLPENGNNHNAARVYVPARGRYYQPDPIGLAGGSNVYAYVGSNPANRVDPTGKFWPELIAIPIVLGITFEEMVEGYQSLSSIPPLPPKQPVNLPVNACTPQNPTGAQQLYNGPELRSYTPAPKEQDLPEIEPPEWPEGPKIPVWQGIGPSYPAPGWTGGR